MSGVTFPMRDYVNLALQEIPTFSGFKFSCQEVMDFGESSQILRDKDYVTLFSGYDQIMLQFLTFKADAAVGTTFNFSAPLYLDIRKHFFDGNFNQAAELQEQSVRMIEVLEDTHNFMGAAKYMMKLLGFDVGPPRLPICDLTSTQKVTVKKRMKERGVFEHLNQL